jgi:predicted  nucleic acid-binding Zn-ribbon protein
MTDQDIEDARAFATMQAPPEDDFPTGTSHQIPSFVGQPPEQIPSAPDWANQILFAIRRDLAENQKRNRESIHELRQDMQRMSANLDVLSHEFERYSTEMRERVNWQEAEIIKHRKAIAELQGDVASLDKRLSAFETDGK